jgi:uncharacterized protein
MRDSRVAPLDATRFRRARLGATLSVLLTLSSAAVTAGDAAGADPLSVVKRLYAAFDRGDLQAVTDSVSEDIVWTQYGPEYSLPFAGVFYGRAGVSRFFKLVDDTLTDVHAGQREFLVLGNNVIVPGWEESTVRSTGGRYRVNNVHAFMVVNGKITQFEEYIDNADVLEAFMPADAARGKALFTTCAGCHGNHAEGRAAMHAPNLTGLGGAYLVQQLRKFRAAHRGNERDTYGFMMMGRASALPGDRGVRDVAAFIDSLPLQRSPSASVGSAERGWTLYPRCAACHGADAEGNTSLGAPSLRQQDDTYMRTQLAHYASGIRGASADDSGESQMRAAAKVLPDAQAVDDVVAFIKSR